MLVEFEKIILEANNDKIKEGNSIVIVTYGMGVYWAQMASTNYPGQLEIIDLRTLFPLDEELIFSSVRNHNKCLIITEEPRDNSFALALSGKIQSECFHFLDGPVTVIGSENVPAIPLNSNLEQEYLPNAKKVSESIKSLLMF